MFNDKRRGDIWWAQDTTHKREGTCLIRGDRPVVIVSSDEVNCNTRIVTVVPLTSSPAQLARGDGTYDQVLLTGYGAPSMALTRGPPPCTGGMKWYTAYLHRTEEILACGTAQQVADALGMKLGSFYTAISRSRTWKNRRYDFVIEEIDEDKFKKEYEI